MSKIDSGICNAEIDDRESYTFSLYAKRPHKVIELPPWWAFWRGPTTHTEMGWERMSWTLPGDLMKMAGKLGLFHQLMVNMQVEHCWGMCLELNPDGTRYATQHTPTEQGIKA